MGGARGPGGGPVAPPPPRSPPRPTLLGSPGSGPAVPLRSDPPSPDLPPTRPCPPPPPRPPQVGGSPPAPPHGRAQGWGRGRLREALRRPPLNRVSSVGLPPNYPQLCPQITHSCAPHLSPAQCILWERAEPAALLAPVGPPPPYRDPYLSLPPSPCAPLTPSVPTAARPPAAAPREVPLVAPPRRSRTKRPAAGPAAGSNSDLVCRAAGGRRGGSSNPGSPSLH